MKENLTFFKSIVKIVIISAMLILVSTVKVNAAETISFDNLGFDEIPEVTTETKKEPETPKTSASKENIPATGSNAEIIYIAGTAVLVGAGIYVFKKQNIKLK